MRHIYPGFSWSILVNDDLDSLLEKDDEQGELIVFCQLIRTCLYELIDEKQLIVCTN